MRNTGWRRFAAGRILGGTDVPNRRPQCLARLRRLREGGDALGRGEGAGRGGLERLPRDRGPGEEPGVRAHPARGEAAHADGRRKDRPEADRTDPARPRIFGRIPHGGRQGPGGPHPLVERAGLRVAAARWDFGAFLCRASRNHDRDSERPSGGGRPEGSLRGGDVDGHADAPRARLHEPRAKRLSAGGEPRLCPAPRDAGFARSAACAYGLHLRGAGACGNEGALSRRAPRRCSSDRRSARPTSLRSAMRC